MSQGNWAPDTRTYMEIMVGLGEDLDMHRKCYPTIAPCTHHNRVYIHIVFSTASHLLV